MVTVLEIALRLVLIIVGLGAAMVVVLVVVLIVLAIAVILVRELVQEVAQKDVVIRARKIALMRVLEDVLDVDLGAKMIAVVPVTVLVVVLLDNQQIYEYNKKRQRAMEWWSG